ncbi:uncharacterized protein LOC102094185 isoform X4 [Columba livia]|uniref:uncharacterized protein LOC102094185 isoform X4 n=1 Tax=Columba livia TaxID=8932 RepID=UPI0031BB225E
MDQSVVYADLKFAVAPTCPTAPDEDDSPYENMPLGTVAPAPSPGNWPRRWRVPAGLLAASLLLLLVATIALGTCYWQVTRRLQDTSREHTAEQDRLSQEAGDGCAAEGDAGGAGEAQRQRKHREQPACLREYRLLPLGLGALQEQVSLHLSGDEDVVGQPDGLQKQRGSAAGPRQLVTMDGAAFCAGEWCQVLDWRVSIKIALVNLRDPMRIHMQSKLFHPGYLHCSHLHPSQAEVLGTA